MEVVGFVLAVVGFAVAGVLWWRSTQQQKAAGERRQALEQQLSAATEASEEAKREAEASAERVQQLEADLAEAEARRDERAMAAALWELELERSFRQWRDVIVPSNSARDESDVNEGQQLAFAISQEVERLREEVGVGIRFDGGLDLPIEPESALAALRISEELLALAAKESDEVVVSLDQGDEPSVIIVVDCQGWGEDTDLDTSPLAQDLAAMAQRLDGTLVWELIGEGSVKTTLRLPAPTPVESA